MASTRGAAAAALVVGALALSSCGGGEEPAPATETSTSTSTATATSTPPPFPGEAERRAAIGRLMIVQVPNFDAAAAAVDAGAGGIIIGSNTDPALLTEPGRDLAALHERAGGGLEVGIDFEGGPVQRLPEIIGDYPSPRKLAATSSPEQVLAVARGLGERLSDLGITTDFAPVIDADINGLSVVGERAFSPDPEVAGRYATAFAQGLAEGGVKPVYKHFPGHGAASGDSHLEEVVTPPLEELKAGELSAYGPALSAVPSAGVMLGHLTVPGLSTEGLPTSLDPAAYELLRSGDYPGGRPFEGVAYTDDLAQMIAVGESFSPEEAAVQAVAAGADRVMWVTGDVTSAIDAIDERVVSGELPWAGIEESAAKDRP
ncbi:glycoside hydrolase family 3 N-terminal domain-containing protein [Corynebacterium otitidis]|uniref:beta-N-acetylhexosaminidase n=1 Tax=Corynebacterium otitidis ATCC 51513 TaxID=883169 RepID=I7JWI9_9CORY|nr:glycoside hydrolase family 3 N-terminal domain-containing protein [Corynebacterium otitidis]EJZ81694.1 hypothetical protein HMPREF9719_01425 [Corynebacterium otitidis ATCC 51513]CCI83881.1 beta-glucosidase [Corynebacterium otitidis ATCC 51513]